MQESLTSRILDFPNDTQLFSQAIGKSSEGSSCSGGDGTDLNSGITGVDPNCSYEEDSFASILSSYYPSMDDSSFSALMEAQPSLDIEAGEFLDSLQQPPPLFFSMEEQQQLDHMVAMAAAADEYSPDSMGHLSEVQTGLPPHPQQSLIQSIYNGEEHFLPAMASAAAYLTRDAAMSGLYQGGMGLPPCTDGGSGEGRGFFPGGIVPVQMPEMEYQNMAVGFYNLQDSFQQHGYGSTDVQASFPRICGRDNFFSLLIDGRSCSTTPFFFT